MRKILPSIETGGLNVSPSYALFPFSFCKKNQFHPNNLTPYFSDVTRIPVVLISLNIIHYAILFSICSTRDKDFNSFFFSKKHNKFPWNFEFFYTQSVLRMHRRQYEENLKKEKNKEVVSNTKQNIFIHLLLTLHQVPVITFHKIAKVSAYL